MEKKQNKDFAVVVLEITCWRTKCLRLCVSLKATQQPTSSSAISVTQDVSRQLAPAEIKPTDEDFLIDQSKKTKPRSTAQT